MSKYFQTTITRFLGWMIPILTLLTLSLQAQQEVDPTWHDPWATPDKATSQPSKPQSSAPKRKVAGKSSPQQALSNKTHTKASTKKETHSIAREHLLSGARSPVF